MSLTPSDSNRTSLEEDLRRVVEQLSKLEIGSLPADNTAVDCARASVHGSSEDEAGKVLALTVLAAALQKRYQISTSKDPSDLDEAIDVTRAAVEITIRESQESAIDDLQVYFINLERSLRFRYEETKGEAQIKESVAIVVSLLDLVQKGSQCHAFTLMILSSLYITGYNRTKTPKYLDEAIDATNSAIAITPENHPFGTVMRQVLAQLHDQCFERTNLLSELDSFISTLQELSEAQNDTIEQFQDIHELTCAFERRHKLTDNIEDLEKAIKYGAAAVKLAPTSPLEGHPISARDVSAHNLRIHTKDYFGRTGNVPELDEHILEETCILQTLVNMDSENKIQHKHKVANAFQKLYERTNRVSDIEYALRVTMHTMQLIDDSQDEWGAIQDTFKAQFRLWSEHTGKMPDCENGMMIFAINGSTYIPPEETGDSDLRTPYMIFIGELPVEYL